MSNEVEKIHKLFCFYLFITPRVGLSHVNNVIQRFNFHFISRLILPIYLKYCFNDRERYGMSSFWVQFKYSKLKCMQKKQLHTRHFVFFSNSVRRFSECWTALRLISITQLEADRHDPCRCSKFWDFISFVSDFMFIVLFNYGTTTDRDNRTYF